MANEHDVILRVGLDTRDADEKARQTARNLSGMAGAGTAGAHSGAGALRIGAGLATGAVGVGAAALAAAGNEKAASTLASVTGEMGRFATMLAPLGPAAAGAGAAIGALAGAAKAFAEDARKTKERLEAESDTTTRSRSSAWIAHLDIDERANDDPRGALSALRSAKRSVRDLTIRSRIGEELSQQEVEYMAAWDPAAAREELGRRTAGRKYDRNDWQFLLLDALNMDELKSRREREIRGTKSLWGHRSTEEARAEVRERWDERIRPAEERYREIAAGKWRNGPAEADLEKRIAEDEAAREAEREAGKSGPARGLFAPPSRADAMQAAGMGVTGGGYDRQEKYLERIVALLGGVERNTGRPARPVPAVAG